MVQTSVFRGRVRIWICALLAAAGAPALGQTTFTDVTQGDLLRQNGQGRGVSWADVDGDGRLDLFVTNWGGSNRLFRNEGPDHFVERTGGLPTEVNDADVDGDGWVNSLDLAMLLGGWGLSDHPADLNDDGVVNAQDLALVLGGWAPPPGTALGYVGTGLGGRAAWADCDNDGDMDVYIAQSGGSALLRNDGNLAFVNITNGLPLSLGGRLARGVAWGDFDSDGLVDLYVSANSGSDDKNFLLRNTPGGFIDATTPPLDDTGVGRGVAWADFDNDGDQDLYLCNGLPGPDVPGNTRNRLFRNDGGGVFTDITAGDLIDDEHSRGVAWGDYDNDGLLDLYITNLKIDGVGGHNHLLRNIGGGVFTDTTHGFLGDTSQTRDCSFVDVDNDGDLDLLIVNAYVFHKMFINNGGVFTPVDARPMITNLGDANSAGWADYDRDGDMDVYIAVAGELSKLFRNDLDNGNHWLVVELTGTQSNRSAIGARVTVSAGGLTQIREVQSGSGYLSQHMLGAHFGLGTAAIVDSVVIRWPSGLVQTLEDVAVDQHLEVVEPE